MTATKPNRRRISFSAYWQDEMAPIIRERCPEDGYDIECHGNSAMFEFVRRAVNQGIDSRLEAVRLFRFDGDHGREGFSITQDTLHVLVRRLLEMEFSEEDEREWRDSPHSVASSICDTLNIELI